MWPEPLHAALVHFPIVLACLAPLAGAAALLVIRRGATSPRVWSGVVLTLLLLTASGWWATETGESDEERVEKVVAERLIEEHEEAGERLLTASFVALGIAAAGYLPGQIGALARVAALAATLLLPAAAFQTGHTGGELVYRHGAASVYASRTARPRAGEARGER